MISTTVALLTLATAGTTTAGSIYATKKQSSATKKAAATQTQTLDKQLAWEREQEATRQKERDEEIALLRQKHEVEQAELNRQAAIDEAKIAEEQARYQARETRLQPARDAGTIAMKDLAAKAATGTQAPNIPGMSRDPYAVMQRPEPQYVTMRDFATPQRGNTTMSIYDLDPRWQRPA